MTTKCSRRTANCVLPVFLAFLIGTFSASAQQTLGSINGTVLDPSGASVPDATITVTNTQIDLTRTAKSGANGFFQIFNLPIGAYSVKITHDGFETTDLTGITVQEARATTVNGTLKVGQVSESVEVTANPLLNATDATNGYTLDAGQIAETPLATGSFTQLAVLSPGVNAELLSGLDSNSGLGNQPIWANGQRDTSNTFQVNGVDVTNLFNGKSSSGSTSQRYNFNIGGGSTSSTSAAGGATTGGANPTGTSVYGSNGNSLPSPVPEFTQEIRVNTSMYDAQQGATSGAQIDVNTATGTNAWHGQVFGTYANNSINSDPFFFKQEYLLATQGVGAFPASLANPYLNRWTTGATVGGPLLKDKVYFFLGYQHRDNQDRATGISQMTVPSGLTDDRSTAGLESAATIWNGGKAYTSGVSPIASSLLNAKLPDGSYLIPSAQSTAPYQYGVPNVTLIGTSVLTADQAVADLDYQALRLRADRRLSGHPEQWRRGWRPRQHHFHRLAPQLGAETGLRPPALLQPLSADPGEFGWRPCLRHRHRSSDRVRHQCLCSWVAGSAARVLCQQPGGFARGQGRALQLVCQYRLRAKSSQSLHQRDLRFGQAHHRGRRRLQLHPTEHRQQPHRHCPGQSQEFRDLSSGRGQQL
jgi:hypothetical protein